jgi:hypothetical protein
MAQSAIALGTERPNIAIALLADLFSRGGDVGDAEKFWTYLDPTEKVNSRPDLEPVKAIIEAQSARLVQLQSPASLLVEKLFSPFDIKNQSESCYVEWDSINSKDFLAFYVLVFAKGLVWGLSHPKESRSGYEAKREKSLKNLPDAIRSGLDVDPRYACPTLDEMCNIIQEFLDSFQKEIRPLSPIPQELLSLPQVIQRIQD